MTTRVAELEHYLTFVILDNPPHSVPENRSKKEGKSQSATVFAIARTQLSVTSFPGSLLSRVKDTGLIWPRGTLQILVGNK